MCVLCGAAGGVRVCGNCAAPQRNAKSPAVWTLNTKLLSLNPDAYTLWNQRKELLVDGFQK